MIELLVGLILGVLATLLAIIFWATKELRKLPRAEELRDEPLEAGPWR